MTLRTSTLVTGLVALTAACSTSSNGTPTPPATSSTTTATASQATGSTSSPAPNPGPTGTTPSTGMTGPTGGATGGTTGGTGGATGGATGASGTPPATTTPSATDEQPGSSSGGPDTSAATTDSTNEPHATDEGSAGPSGPAPSSSGPDVITVSSCVGGGIPSANPKAAGPFQTTADKNVGPQAGSLPDPIYGDEQQRFNVYRPANLGQSEYCHPILIWANGYQDNPEQNPPDCIVDQNANRWCGQYLPMMNHLASHGFVVVASLSTATGREPYPTLVGLDWILEQAEDPESPYYHRLDTTNIGQLGHSFGGMSTCLTASEPRYKALATICGTQTLSGVHTPMLFFCGGKDTTVECDGVKQTYQSVTNQPAFFLNERDADHGSWVYQGAGGVSLSAAAAWFRAHLMGDAESRKFFYGPNCTFCTDNRVEAEQNTLMAQ